MFIDDELMVMKGSGCRDLESRIVFLAWPLNARASKDVGSVEDVHLSRRYL